ncbi:MAG: hypothetical protein WCO02_10260 [Bacteroidota bacterium]
MCKGIEIKRDAGCRMQDAGCRMQDSGCGMQDSGCGMQDAGCRMSCILDLASVRSTIILHPGSCIGAKHYYLASWILHRCEALSSCILDLASVRSTIILHPEYFYYFC